MKGKAITTITVMLFLASMFTVSMVHAPGRGAQNVQMLGMGWDVHTYGGQLDPLKMGRVIFNRSPSNNQQMGTNNLQITVILRGAVPNTAYGVGLVIFDYTERLTPPAGVLYDVNSPPDTWYLAAPPSFGGIPQKCYIDPWTRWGYDPEVSDLGLFTVKAGVYELGWVTTDSRGTGSFDINLSITGPKGAYPAQFYLSRLPPSTDPPDPEFPGFVMFNTGAYLGDYFLLEAF